MNFARRCGYGVALPGGRAQLAWLLECGQLFIANLQVQS